MWVNNMETHTSEAGVSGSRRSAPTVLSNLVQRFGRFHRAGRKRDADRVAEEIIAALSPMIHRLAKPLMRHDLDYEDMFQAGRIALYEALTRFDPRCGASFSTFAYNSVFGQLHLHVNRGSREIAEPAYLGETRRRVKRAADFLPVDATREQLAETAGVTQKMLDTLDATEKTLLTTARFGSAEDGMIDPEVNPVFATSWTDAADARIAIEQLLPRLSPTYQCILKRRFFEDETLESIATSLGCSRENVRAMESRALAKLRALMASE